MSIHLPSFCPTVGCCYRFLSSLCVCVCNMLAVPKWEFYAKTSSSFYSWKLFISQFLPVIRHVFIFCHPATINLSSHTIRCLPHPLWCCCCCSAVHGSEINLISFPFSIADAALMDEAETQKIDKSDAEGSVWWWYEKNECCGWNDSGFWLCFKWKVKCSCGGVEGVKLWVEGRMKTCRVTRIIELIFNLFPRGRHSSFAN